MKPSAHQRKSLKPFIITAFLSAAALSLLAQEKIAGSARDSAGSSPVRWVSQYPVPGGEAKPKNMLEKVARVIAGKKEGLRVTRPVSVAALNPDTFYILDQGSKTLFQVLRRSAEVPRCIRKSSADLSSLVGTCLAPGNRILFTDSKLNRIFGVSADRRELRTLNDSLKLMQPTGIAYSLPKHEIWVAETAAHQLLVLDESGKMIRTVGHRGTGPGEFNFPTSVWIDRKGEVYVVDAMNFRIQIFDPEGNFISAFGEAGDATGYMARPKGVATDSAGNIYVADALLHAVQVFDRQGSYLYRFGQQGHGYGEFWMPSGIFIDRNDFIYVADSFNSRVQVFRISPR